MMDDGWSERLRTVSGFTVSLQDIRLSGGGRDHEGNCDVHKSEIVKVVEPAASNNTYEDWDRTTY